MSTVTLGSNATTSLTAVLFAHDLNNSNPSGLAAINNSILDDANPAHPLIGGSFASNGLLYIPRRGVLKVFPGDYVGVDSTGWPVLVAKNAIANGPWTHT